MTKTHVLPLGRNAVQGRQCFGTTGCRTEKIKLIYDGVAGDHSIVHNTISPLTTIPVVIALLVVDQLHKIKSRNCDKNPESLFGGPHDSRDSYEISDSSRNSCHKSHHFPHSETWHQARFDSFILSGAAQSYYHHTNHLPHYIGNSLGAHAANGSPPDLSNNQGLSFTVESERPEATELIVPRNFDLSRKQSLSPQWLDSIHSIPVPRPVEHRLLWGDGIALTASERKLGIGPSARF